MHTIDPELPWGCWLRIEPDGSSDPVFVNDETGERWHTIREAFWFGRLKMSLRQRGASLEHLERMHALLLSLLPRNSGSDERASDLFDGNSGFERFFLEWLAKEGFVAANQHGHYLVTNEGMAVVQMLAATRPIPVRQARREWCRVTRIEAVDHRLQTTAPGRTVNGPSDCWTSCSTAPPKSLCIGQPHAQKRGAG